MKEPRQLLGCTGVRPVGRLFLRDLEEEPLQIASQSLTFVNHASVLIKGATKSVLSDPWYEGDGFHKGWKLLVDNEPPEIKAVLAATSHIWISHEHPDHFAIGFFKKYKQDILARSITILFQVTKDGRVVNFLRSEGFQTLELEGDQELELEPGFLIKVMKDEFYDSALLLKVNGLRILNLNDCPLHSIDRIKKFKKTYGTCDVLLTQFSYAAWKGGRENKEWRLSAAAEKLDTLVNQGNILEAKHVIPFASFVRFANELNAYLNDSINTPYRVTEHCRERGANFKCVVMHPLESVEFHALPEWQSDLSIDFWDRHFRVAPNFPVLKYSQSLSLGALKPLFESYCKRLKAANSWQMVKIIGKLNLLGAFQPIAIRLIDTNEVIAIDLPNEKIYVATVAPHIALHSESLAFIFRNPFGFDTLTVNGTFEELQTGGFGRLTKNFAIENLNNLGYSLRPSLAFNVKLLGIFARRLSKVAKKLQ